MKTKPIVGRYVYLNDWGIDQIGGLHNRAEARDSMKMKILEVQEPLYVYGEEVVYPIEVSGELGKYMLDNTCVDYCSN